MDCYGETIAAATTAAQAIISAAQATVDADAAEAAAQALIDCLENQEESLTSSEGLQKLKRDVKTLQEMSARNLQCNQRLRS